MAERARNPEALEHEIERTREELAQTIDELADRVNPKTAALRGVTRLKEEAGSVAAALGGLVSPGSEHDTPGLRRDDRTAAVLVGAGVVLAVTAVVIFWGRRRRR